jgi:hypothetical protein
LLLGAIGTAHGSPYHIPGLDAADEWELKLSAEQTKQRDQRLLEAPVIDITAPLVPGLEASIAFGRGRLDSDNEQTHDGWLDTELAVKWELIDANQGRAYGVTIEPALFAPTGSDGLKDAEWALELPVIVGWTFAATDVRALVGYAHSLESDDDELSCGGVLEYAISERLSIGAELTTEVPADDLDAWSGVADVGFRLELTPNIELQGRIGRSVHTNDEPRPTEGALFFEVAL